MSSQRNWRQLERHPLSAEFEDIAGDEWKALLRSIEKHGFDPRKPIVLAPDLDDKGRMKIGDGWQRQRACLQLGVRPVYVILPGKMTLEELIERDNEARRHESIAQRDKRIAARNKRISKAIESGKTYREVAEEEGINVSTVHKAATKSGAAERAPNAQERLGANGEVPKRLSKIFESRPMFRSAAAMASKAAAAFKALEKTEAYKSIEGDDHKVYSSIFTVAFNRAAQACPAEICSECKGHKASMDAEDCAKCQGKGYLTVGEVKG